MFNPFSNSLKSWISWTLSLLTAGIFIQSLFFKFTNAPETIYILTVTGVWLSNTLFASLSDYYILYGGYVIGGLELISSLLLLYPKTRFFGAQIGLGVMTGALFFHIFTPLGIVIVNGGVSDHGLLFSMACFCWLSCAVLSVFSPESASIGLATSQISEKILIFFIVSLI